MKKIVVVAEVEMCDQCHWYCVEWMTGALTPTGDYWCNTLDRKLEGYPEIPPDCPLDDADEAL